MRNSKSEEIDHQSELAVGNLFYVALLTALAFGFGVLDHDPMLIAICIGGLGVCFAVCAPFLVRSVKHRDPPGDTWRAVAWVAYAGLPFAFFIPFWSQLTAWPGSIAAYPVVGIWSCAGLVIAGLEEPRTMSPRTQTVFFGVAGAIYAIAAGPIYLGLVIALFSGMWTPPDGKTERVALVLVLGLPWAWFSAHAAIELLGRANQPGPRPDTSPPA